MSEKKTIMTLGKHTSSSRTKSKGIAGKACRACDAKVLRIHPVKFNGTGPGIKLEKHKK